MQELRVFNFGRMSGWLMGKAKGGGGGRGGGGINVGVVAQGANRHDADTAAIHHKCNNEHRVHLAGHSSLLIKFALLK